MTEHDLKCWPVFFAAVLDGSKPFEVRRDDRGYKVGDVLHLMEWDEPGCVGDFTGNECRRTVTYCLRGEPFVPEGYVVMGLRSLDTERLNALQCADELYFRRHEEASASFHGEGPMGKRDRVWAANLGDEDHDGDLSSIDSLADAILAVKETTQ